MKKSLFVLTMAVMAVCSFVFTSCYDKPVSPKVPSVYYVVGSVYDAQTGEVINNATVTLDGKAVSSTFNVKLDSYVPSVTVAASAEGYVPASRTVSIDKLDEYNQVSYTNADIALVKVQEPDQPDQPSEPDTVVVVVGNHLAGAAHMNAAAVRAMFGINHGEVVVGDKGLVEVFVHYGFVDSHLNVDVHTNIHANQVLGSTHEPYTVKDSTFSGYVWDYRGTEYVNELKSALNYALGTVNVGSKYADFAATASAFTEVLNQDGSMCLVGYCVCKDFTLWTVPVSIDGVEFSFMALQYDSTHVSPIVGDCHDNHDNHDNHVNGDKHDNHHNNHNNHTGATAYGGGLGDAE